MTAVALGLATGMVIICVLVLALFALAGMDPPAEPADAVHEDAQERDALFQPDAWKKSRTAPAIAPAYHRPLDVAPVPANEILPPPREVQGVNEEN